MTVHNNTARWYRYIDMTPQAEALFRFIDQIIDTELSSELAFLANYDETKRAIQKIVDMPDRKMICSLDSASRTMGAYPYGNAIAISTSYQTKRFCLWRKPLPRIRR